MNKNILRDLSQYDLTQNVATATVPHEYTSVCIKGWGDSLKCWHGKDKKSKTLKQLSAIFISTYDVSVKRCGILNEYCSCKYLCSLSVRIFQRIIFIITANSLDDRRRLGKNTLLQAAPARLQVCHPGEGVNENLQWFYTLNIKWHLRLTLLTHKIFREGAYLRLLLDESPYSHILRILWSAKFRWHLGCEYNMCGYEDCCEAGVLQRLEAGDVLTQMTGGSNTHNNCSLATGRGTRLLITPRTLPYSCHA